MTIQRAASPAPCSARAAAPLPAAATPPTTAVSATAKANIAPGKKVQLKLPSLYQFSLQTTWWEARWEPAVLAAFGQARRTQAAARAAAALGTAVYRAGRGGDPPTPNAVLKVERAHRHLVAALRSAGCPEKTLRTLDRHFSTYVRWWRQSGRTACALAAEMLLRLVGATETKLGPIFSGARRSLARSTAWYPSLSKTPGAPPSPKLYKGRRVTYDVTYQAARLRRVANVIIAKLNAGQPVHVRVLTGYLHRDAGPGRPPRATHSLVLTGYQVLRRRGGGPERVAFAFRDPDGGGQATLVLDAAHQTFEQRPAHPAWEHWAPHGWRYGALEPPHYRYQVLSVR